MGCFLGGWGGREAQIKGYLVSQICLGSENGLETHIPPAKKVLLVIHNCLPRGRAHTDLRRGPFKGKDDNGITFKSDCLGGTVV